MRMVKLTDIGRTLLGNEGRYRGNQTGASCINLYFIQIDTGPALGA